MRRIFMRPYCADWISSCKEPVELAGIIYLHSVAAKRDTATAGPPSAYICSRLKESCNIVLATTMWNSKSAQGEMWEESFKSADKWRMVLDAGSVPFRFDDSFESAWDIIKEGA